MRGRFGCQPAPLRAGSGRLGEGTRQQLRPPTVSAGRPPPLRLVFALWGLRGRRRDPRPPLAPGRQHTRVANRVQPWGRHAGGQPAQQRQRVHVHRHRPVPVCLLQDDAHTTVGAMLQALLRDGWPQHVAQQRLSPRRVQPSGTSRPVQREPTQRSAQRLVVGEWLWLERCQAPHPLRPRGRCLARDRRGSQVVLGIARQVRVAVVLVQPQQAPSPQVPLETSDGPLQHAAHLAGLQVPDPPPPQLATLLVPGPVESHHVQVRVETE